MIIGRSIRSGNAGLNACGEFLKSLAWIQPIRFLWRAALDWPAEPYSWNYSRGDLHFIVSSGDASKPSPARNRPVVSHADLLERELDLFGIELLPHQKVVLAGYCDELARWNKKINLTAL